MTWHEEIARLRQELRSKIAWAINAVFVFTTVSNTTALGDSDSIKLADDDPTKGQRPVRRIELFGFRSRPVSGQRCLAIRLGSSTVFYLGIASDGGYGPSDLADGETALYCKQGGTEIRLDQDGNIKINAAPEADVVVNGGSAKVARVGDHTTAHTHTMTFSLSSATGGAVTGTITAASANPTIAEGADHFKG